MRIKLVTHPEMRTIFGLPYKKLRIFSKLWWKFYWYKYIKRLDIIGFYSGIPVVRTKHLEVDKEKEVT